MVMGYTWLARNIMEQVFARTFKALGCARNIMRRSMYLHDNGCKVVSASMDLLSSTLTLLFFLRDMLAALSSLMPLL
jgi:hypothetical protein